MMTSKVVRPIINYVLKRNCVSNVTWCSQVKKERFEKYGGKYNLAIIEGREKTKDLMRALEDLLLCTGAPLSWETFSGSIKTDEDFTNLILTIRRNGLAIKGNLDKSIPDEMVIPAMSKNMAVRRALDLHAFITEIKTFQGLKQNSQQPIDVVIVRQNTEGDYMMLEHMPNERIVEHLRVITLKNSVRVAEAAFKYATKKNRKKVQCLHRRHILPLSEQVFIKGFYLAAKWYPNIETELVEVGKAFHAFLKDTKALDVVVTNSLDGIMLKSAMCGMLGTPALVAGANLGDEMTVFEPASRLKEEERNNPTPYFLSGALLLEYLGLENYATAIRESLDEVFMDKILPADLGGTADLSTFTKAVIRQVQKKTPYVLCSLNAVPKIPKNKPVIPIYKP